MREPRAEGVLKKQENYTATSFKIPVDFMKDHRGIYVLVDAGYTSI